MLRIKFRQSSGVAVMDDRTLLERLTAFAGLGRVLFRRPHDSIGAIVATAAVMAIFVNALWLQPNAHPAPMFPTKWRPVSTGETTGSLSPVLPRPRPAEMDVPKVDVPATSVRTRAQITTDIQRELVRRKFYDGTVDGVYGSKTDAAIRDFEHAAGLKSSTDPDEALLKAILRSPVQSPPPAVNAKRGGSANAIAPSKKLVAVQRVLADYGYGQVPPTGIPDPATKAAIERFERERKLPITGQVSDRLMRELAALTGRPLE